jgi:hypothetical protein
MVYEGHAGRAVAALEQAIAVMPHAASSYLAIAQVHATLEVAHQLELLRIEGLRVGKMSLFGGMHMCMGRGGNIPTSGTEADCRWCQRHDADGA